MLASEPERLTGFWLQSGPAVEGIDPMASIPSRAAENLWWLGRYAERAEAVDPAAAHRPRPPQRLPGQRQPAGIAALRALLDALTRITATYPGFARRRGTAAAAPRPGDELLALVVDDQRDRDAGPLGAGAARRGLRGPRPAVAATPGSSSGRSTARSRELRGPVDDRAGTRSRRRCSRSCRACSRSAASASRAWCATSAGGSWTPGGGSSAAIQLLSLLRDTVTQARGTATDSLVLESVLTAAESIITYRRRYRSQAQLETVLDLLLLDSGNPRSLAYQLERLTEDLDALPVPAERRLREEQRLVARGLDGARGSPTRPRS